MDAVVAGYPAQPDAVPAWCVARARRVPLVVDMMISLSDTLAGDRGRADRASAAALAGIDRLSLRLADLVMADTETGAAWLVERFDVPRERIVVVPVGAEPDRFPYLPEPDGPPHALFYGKLAPLHGVGTVIEAARAPGSPPLRLIGDGQLGPWLEAELAPRPPRGPGLGALGALRASWARRWPGRRSASGSSARATRRRGWCRTRCGRRWPPGGRW